jgi:uncharacterized protein
VPAPTLSSACTTTRSKTSLTAPPIDDRANEALIAFLADRLSLPKSCIELAGCATSRNKLLRIRDKTAAEIEAPLLSSLTLSA